MGGVILIYIIPTETNLIYIIMKQDLKNLFKKLVRKTIDRAKFLILIFLTIGGLFGGLWFGVNSLISGGADILIFLASSVGVWFGIGMIDMFNDINK